jgi:hypothetical protein
MGLNVLMPLTPISIEPEMGVRGIKPLPWSTIAYLGEINVNG